jgi:5'(3')-deoxyribonucleotidase
MMKKPIICIDFDGVIHSYEHGWQNGSIYGTVTTGFFGWAAKAQEKFDLYIYSSRSSTPEGIKAMDDWLKEQAHKHWDGPTIYFHFVSEKPPAWITIDDRAIQFKGNWLADDLNINALANFKPWNSNK